MRGLQRPEGQRLSREAALLPGTDINIILASSSAMGDDAIRALCEQLAALLLDSAEGEDLDRLVADRFSPTVVRKQAAPALVTLSITRSAGTLPATTLNVGTKVRTENGVEFHYADWRPLAERSHLRAKQMGLYLQSYCGCVFSEWERFRDTTRHVYRGQGPAAAKDTYGG